MAFEHRAGAFLNENYHWHVEVTDGVFADDGIGGDLDRTGTIDDTDAAFMAAAQGCRR